MSNQTFHNTRSKTRKIAHNLFRSAALGTSTIALTACTISMMNSGGSQTTKHCEPTGTVFVEPVPGPEILHSVYTAPAPGVDGWPVANLNDAGFDPEQINDMLAAIKNGHYSGINSVLVVRNGTLVFEAYFNGFDRKTPHNIRSAFKSFTSTLAGISLDKGLIGSVHQPISGFFPDRWAATARGDRQKEEITLAHLLTMQAGFNRHRGLDDADDWYRFALDQPMGAAPGTRFDYSDGNSMLIGGAIASAAGIPLTEFAKANLFAPMGIRHFCWTLTPTGQPMTDGSFYMRPRDFAKLGQLYLDEGRWQGRQIVSADWVKKAIRERVLFSPPTKRKLHMNYGYHWWIRHLAPTDDNRLEMFAASGGSQKLVVYPNLKLVVAFTGGRYFGWEAHQQPWKILDRYILPALVGEQAATTITGISRKSPS